MQFPQKRGYRAALIFVALMLFSMRALASWQAAPKYFVPLVAAQTGENEKPIDFAPIDYFDRNCARCHGNYGTNYGPTLAMLPDAKLKQVIDEMASGPGQAPLDELQLERETAYHRSLRDGKPFVAVTKINEQPDGLMLSGEVTPDTKLSIQAGADQSTLAILDRHTWRANLPAKTDLQTVRITAEKSGATSVVNLSESMFSHQTQK